jgi:hypothetical protein
MFVFVGMGWDGMGCGGADIDFGHFLGHYRKLMGTIYADKADLVFIDQYYAIIGKENYSYFVDLCCKAYNIIRKHANLFLILFSLVK